MTTIKQLVDEYNKRATTAGVPTLKQWKRSKEELAAKLGELEHEAMTVVEIAGELDMNPKVARKAPTRRPTSRSELIRVCPKNRGTFAPSFRTRFITTFPPRGGSSAQFSPSVAVSSATGSLAAVLLVVDMFALPAVGAGWGPGDQVLAALCYLGDEPRDLLQKAHRRGQTTLPVRARIGRDRANGRGVFLRPPAIQDVKLHSVPLRIRRSDRLYRAACLGCAEALEVVLRNQRGQDVRRAGYQESPCQSGRRGSVPAPRVRHSSVDEPWCVVEAIDTWSRLTFVGGVLIDKKFNL